MITRILIVLNVLVFGWEVYYSGGSMLGIMGGNGGAGEQRVLVAGALVPVLVTQYHQWWRVVTGAFMHGGLLHIGVNMYSLYVLGRFIESIAGSARMLVIYLVALVASGLCVVYFSAPEVPTLGASGAIFGLFGALFAIGFKLGPQGRGLVQANIGILVINLLFSLSPGISWQAHVGGLVSGFLLALIIYFPPRRVAPVVVDSRTGNAYETEYQAPPPQQHQ